MADTPKLPQDQSPAVEAREPNEGEGNKSADRAYRQHVEDFMDANDVERLAREAERDVERDPSLRDAEAEGKRHIAEEDPEVRR